VNDALFVGILQRRKNVAGDPQCLAQGDVPSPQESLSQRLPLDVRHGVPELAFGLAKIEERQDVKMAELGGKLDLPEETLRPQARRQLGMDHLQCHRPVLTAIVGQVHRGHAAPAQLALHSVPVGQREHD
jgi:hypothetical protein